jgi:hypothetical protein
MTENITDLKEQKPTLVIVINKFGGVEDIISDQPDKLNVGNIWIFDYDNDDGPELTSITQSDGGEERALVTCFDQVSPAGPVLQNTINKLNKTKDT